MCVLARQYFFTLLKVSLARDLFHVPYLSSYKSVLLFISAMII